MASWLERTQEESYLSQLDSMLITRLKRRGDDVDAVTLRKQSAEAPRTLSGISKEINEELDRLESLLLESEAVDSHYA
ncbi:MAG: hypothetical protein MUD03_10675 [Pirellula sp.]|nr:hypothetical protein [Pirellula sp.]